MSSLFFSVCFKVISHYRIKGICHFKVHRNRKQTIFIYKDLPPFIRQIIFTETLLFQDNQMAVIYAVFFSTRLPTSAKRGKTFPSRVGAFYAEYLRKLGLQGVQCEEWEGEVTILPPTPRCSLEPSAAFISAECRWFQFLLRTLFLATASTKNSVKQSTVGKGAMALQKYH